MGSTARSETVRSSKSYKAILSSDCSLELDYMKLELLVMASQHIAVNMSLFLALTARHSMGVDVL